MAKKVSLTYFTLCLKILKNVSYHDELIDLTIFSWTCRNGQVDVVKGDFFCDFHTLCILSNVASKMHHL